MKIFVFSYILLAQSLCSWSQINPVDSDHFQLTPEKLAVLEQRANRGEALAEWMLGNAYRKGEGVPQDYTTAARWYAAASAQKLAEAQVVLGYLYEQGKGVRKDYREALRYFRAAAEQGNSTAENNLGEMYADG